MERTIEISFAGPPARVHTTFAISETRQWNDDVKMESNASTHPQINLRQHYNVRTQIQREHSYCARSGSRTSFRISNQNHTNSNSIEIFCIFVFTIFYWNWISCWFTSTHPDTQFTIPRIGYIHLWLCCDVADHAPSTAAFRFSSTRICQSSWRIPFRSAKKNRK